MQTSAAFLASGGLRALDSVIYLTLGNKLIFTKSIASGERSL